MDTWANLSEAFVIGELVSARHGVVMRNASSAVHGIMPFPSWRPFQKEHLPSYNWRLQGSTALSCKKGSLLQVWPRPRPVLH